eukprot:3422204-Pyramimonas_sp.AAC.1
MGSRHAVLGVGDAYGLRQWDLRWSSLRSHEKLYWVGGAHANCAPGTVGGSPYGATDAVLGVGDAYGLRHWDLRWSSLWDH